MRMQIKLLTVIVAISASVAATPNLRVDDKPPRLVDTLAVAKSPLEPVTLAQILPGARNDNLVAETASLPGATVADFIQDKRTTRSAQSLEQERDATASTSAESEPDSTTKWANLEPNETSVTETSAAEESTTLDALDPDNSTTKATTLDSSTLAETTSPFPFPSPSTTTESPMSSDSSTTSIIVSTTEVSDGVPMSDISSTEATTKSVEEVTPVTEIISSSSTTIATTTINLTTTAAPPLSTATSPSEGTTTEETEAPTTTSTSTTQASTPTETTLGPAREQSTVGPASSTTESSTMEPSSSVAPTIEEVSNQPEKGPNQEKENNASCNHLPTYEAEEIQKVFREETTFKNGTIKGKFTYINFDQRYRLVHYTRLPYGPVKIDLVEELGRPEQNANRTSAMSPNEIPNAVLQLRNILPNSLFGFPFVGPNSANKPLEPKDGRSDGSNSYFYSTDSITTPNLLTPSVPVSLLPGQRKLPQPSSSPAADVLDQSYHEKLAPGPINAPRPQEVAGDATSIYGATSQYRLQYSSAQAVADPKQPSFIYTYLTQPQPQYQYSPLPYTQTAYQSIAPPLAYNSRTKQQDGSIADVSFVSHRTHQPHSHEHYVAPFMFAQPPGPTNEQPEASKLRLKVKTSKSLNVNQESAARSAKLRAPVLSSQVQESVATYIPRQHKQRAGKQNHDLRPTINTSPVVYHILRSPIGRMYTLPQYNQAHAIAYDHDA